MSLDQLLQPLRPTSIVVLLAGEIAALCTPDRVYPADILDAIPTSHPDRALVDVKCLIAGAVLNGDFEGPYDDHEADQLARSPIEDEITVPRRPWLGCAMRPHSGSRGRRTGRFGCR